MIKIIQDLNNQNYIIEVSNFNTQHDNYKNALRVKNILNKHGKSNILMNKGIISVKFVSYNDNISADDILLILFNGFNVGCLDYLGIQYESYVNNGLVATNKYGSIIKLHHKNAYKLLDDEELIFTLVDGLRYFNIHQDLVHIKTTNSHVDALLIMNTLFNLLESYK